MKIPKVTTIDWETFGIEPRPFYPPEPVSVSIKPWGKKPKFYAWGHLNGKNNCSKEQAVRALVEAYANPDGVLFHNARFDIDVAEVHLGLKPPPWQRIHETMFLLFLDDPHQKDLKLKPAAERVLGLPPEERDAVRDWLLANQPVPGVKISGAEGGKEPYGKYIAWAPPSVVGPYANGDVERTEGIFRKLYPSIVKRGMLPAYDRERKLTPILLAMERRGIRVDLCKLRADVATYQSIADKLEIWIKRKIGGEFKISAPAQLVNAMVEAGLADPALMGVTEKTGRTKADKAAIKAGVTDKQLAATLQYYTQLRTCLNTFMKPWLLVAEKSVGYIFTHWHQTRGERDSGTRTGRFSSTPNFQNIPKEFEPLYWHEVPLWNAHQANPKDHKNSVDFPKSPIRNLPPLPLMRSYVLPYTDGHVLVGRDYSQQEPRILAHFEDGALQAQYRENPWIDFHDNAKDNLERIYHRPFSRRPVKNINLGIIYGQGVYSLSLKNGEHPDTTKEVLKAIMAMYPGLKAMREDMKTRSIMKLPIHTWGGRECFCEEPKVVDGRIKTYDYKMVNTLVQGSAADCTKEGMIRFYEHRAQMRHTEYFLERVIAELEARGWYMLLQVHDEIVLSVPERDLEEAQEWLRVVMESVEFDVKILSEGSWSDKNWAAMIDYDKKGVIIYDRKRAA